MNAQAMWDRYCAQYNVHADYQAWQFGADPDDLAILVLNGIKTATSSAYCFYELEDIPLPQTGEYHIILNSRDEAVCIIRTTNVSIIPFSEVSAEHAYKEGEGDRSLKYWQNVHAVFFKEEFSKIGKTFEYQTKVVCEEFVCLFP